MNRIFSEDNLRYPSLSQDYGSPPSLETWNSSKFSNGPSKSSADIRERPLNHHSLSQNYPNNTTSFLPQKESRSPGSAGMGDSGEKYSGYLKSRSTPYLFDTGEPLGSLSSAIAQKLKTKKPSREEMKEKLVSSLSSDSSVGILPGYKSSRFTGGGFHGLRNSQSSTLYGQGSIQSEPQRIPSPVARAQAAIGTTRQEVGAAQKFLQGNNNRINEIYRHPGGDKWLNASTPGAGCDSESVRRIKQDSYRRDLETQMEQSRLRKADELKRDREGLEHPLGTGYNSHSIYTLSMEDPKLLDKSSSNNPKHLEARHESVDRKFSNSSTKSDSDLGKQQQIGGDSPWLDKPDMGIFVPKPPQFQKDYYNQNAAPQLPPSNQFQPPAKSPPRPPPQQAFSQQQQSYAPNQYFPTQPMAMYPYGYPYAPPPPPPSMPYQMFPPPLPTQIQQFQAQQQSMCPLNQQMNSQEYNMLPKTNYSRDSFQPPSSSLDLQLQQERFVNGIQKSDGRQPMAATAEDMEEEEVEQTKIRQHIWQTSDQLASDELKKSVYQSMLKKQIIQKKRITEEERLREAEDNERLERSIEEYQMKMRKQFEAEQQLIKRKQGGNAAENVPFVSDIILKKRHLQPFPDFDTEAEFAAPEVALHADDLEENKQNCAATQVAANNYKAPSRQNEAISDIERHDDADAGDCFGGGVADVKKSHPVSTPNFVGSGDDPVMENNSNPIENLTFEEKYDKSTSATEDLQILSQIKEILSAEIRQMERLMGKST